MKVGVIGDVTVIKSIESRWQELARRESDGLDIRLYWRREDNELMVAVADERSGEIFALPAAPDRALDVFYHPFAYAAGGVEVRIAA